MPRPRRHSAIRVPLALALGFALTLAATPAAAGPLFAPQYSPSPSDGFNDPDLGPARRAALEFSLSLWAAWLVPAYAGQTIIVAVNSIPTTGNTLAEGGPADIYRVGADPNRVTPLANNFYGRDTNPGQPEIYVDFDINADFYLGFDGRTPANRYDFVTTALHEIGHGLGILDIIDRNTGGYYRNAGPSVYENFLAETAGVYTPLTAMTDADRLAAIGSNDLWWTGTNASAANGGQPVRIYAPPVASDSSGVSHLPLGSGSLWAPSLGRGESIHTLNAIDRGLFLDLGYTIASKPPAVIFQPSCGTNGFCFTFQTTPGVSYAIEFKDALADPQWTALDAPAIVGNGTAQTIRDPAGQGRQRFYRVKCL